MSRVFVLIGLAFSNALHGIRRASTTSLMAVLTIAIVLVLVGGAALLVHNMSSILDEFGSELQLTAYLEEGLSEADQRELAERVAAAPGVEHVDLVTKAMALERFVEIAGSEALLAGLEENPLPASLEIHLRPEARTAEAIGLLEASLDGLPGIGDLAQGQEWIAGYARAVSMVRAGVVAIAIVLGMAALLIVANTIRLAVYARQDELEILSLVGASRTFVRVPFLLEGTLQGLLGGGLALLVVWSAFELLQPQIREGLELVLGSADLHFFTTGEALWLVASGAALGLLGSIMALVGGRA